MEYRHAHGMRDRLQGLPFVLQMQLFGLFANNFGVLIRHLPPGVGQDNDEFIAAIPAGNILTAHMPKQQITQFTQDGIPRGMA
jgi:hypothetical protein